MLPQILDPKQLNGEEPSTFFRRLRSERLDFGVPMRPTIASCESGRSDPSCSGHQLSQSQYFRWHREPPRFWPSGWNRSLSRNSLIHWGRTCSFGRKNQRLWDKEDTIRFGDDEAISWTIRTIVTTRPPGRSNWPRLPNVMLSQRMLNKTSP